MASLRQQKKAWKALVAKNPDPYWFELFEGLFKQLNAEFSLLNTLYLKKGEFSQIIKKELDGTVFFDDAQIQYNQLRNTLLKVIDAITEDDLGGGNHAADDELDVLLKQLRLKRPLSPLQLVNCDRVANHKNFKKAFRNWERDARRYQFYFSLGCYTQRPGGFGERMVLEIVERRLARHADSVDYPRGADHRLLIPDLPVGFDEEDCKVGLKKYVAERFGMKQFSSDAEMLEALAKRKVSLIAFPFAIPTGDWDSDVLTDYLQWIIDTFSETDGKGPTFVFVFIIRLKNAHEKEKLKYDREVLDDIEELTLENEVHARFLYPFKPVPRFYVEKWLNSVDDTLTTPVVDDILQTFIRRFSTADQATIKDEDFLIDMEHVMRLQERIWQLHQ